MNVAVGVSRAGGRELLVAREQFLTGQARDLPIRDEILTSWRRSRLCGVDPERINPSYDPNVESHRRLLHVAEPVLSRLAERLANTSTSVFLADQSARALRRWVPEKNLATLLDRLSCAPGFSFDEEQVGTNGAGTALEARSPVMVAGPEHYAAALQDVTCVSAPIRNPISRRIEGLVVLASAYRDTNDLMLVVAVEVAQAVEERLYLDASANEQILLRHFLAAARRSHRPVVLLNDQVFLANPSAANLLHGVDQTLLWQEAARAMGTSETVHEVTGTGGQPLRVQFRPVKDDAMLVGCRLDFEIPDAAPAQRIMAPAVESLPGLAGRSEAWRRMTADALAHLHHQLPLVVAGEEGVGKMAVVQALQAVAGKESCVLDCRHQVAAGSAWVHRLSDALAGPADVVVLRHLEALEDSAAQTLWTAVDRAVAAGHPRLIATVPTDGASVWPPLWALLRGARLEVPALRHRPEDILDLVAHILRTSGSRARFRPEAMQALSRYWWPGNVRELEQTVKAAAGAARAGEVRLEDLPRDIRSATGRRPLSRLEQAEADTIVAVLDEVEHNLAKAATVLQISRTTLYRKLRAYDLLTAAR